MDKQEHEPERTHYANTDLKIVADRKPFSLQEAFDQHEFFDMWERPNKDSPWEGNFETSERYNEPDANIASFLSVIEALEEPALNEWRSCTLREFDIGYSAGHEPFDYSQALSLETISRIAKVGASLRITVYAPKDRTPPYCL